jgi:hypothetical protein
MKPETTGSHYCYTLRSGTAKSRRNGIPSSGIFLWTIMGRPGRSRQRPLGSYTTEQQLSHSNLLGRLLSKAGKEARREQNTQTKTSLRRVNYTTMIHALWPMDYAVFAIWRVVNEAQYGALVTTDEKKRSDIVIEFFNAVLLENCGRAVHGQYPLVFEQVKRGRITILLTMDSMCQTWVRTYIVHKLK